jgi:CheY-like chemotaxis protein
VLTAADGASAVSTVRRERPDLVLLDISFPPDVAHGGGVAWDGFLIMNWLRRIDEAKDTPVIIITGGDPGQYKDRSLAAGAIAFFQKPLNNDELLETIRQTIGEPQAPLGTPSAA